MLREQVLTPALRHARAVSAELIAAFWPGRDGPEVDRRIAALPPRHQALVLAGVLGLLFLSCLFAAQFGMLGLSLLFMALVVLIA